MDNAHPHISERSQRSTEASRAERLPYPTYSPDPAPSDPLLFGYSKRKLPDYNCQSYENLLNAITEIFTGVDKEVLFNVFESWVNKLKWAEKHEEKYSTKSRKNKRPFVEVDRENGRT
jgi:hypothetical protein